MKYLRVVRDTSSVALRPNSECQSPSTLCSESTHLTKLNCKRQSLTLARSGSAQRLPRVHDFKFATRCLLGAPCPLEMADGSHDETPDPNTADGSHDETPDPDTAETPDPDTVCVGH